MEFRKKLIDVNRKYKSELSEILNFADTTERHLTTQFNTLPEGGNIKELRDVANAILSTCETGSAMSIKVSSGTANLIKEKLVPFKHKGFLMDMTLSYLISYQESMFKDYIFCVLVSQPNSLKSKNTITYVDLLNYESMEDVITFLAQKEVEQLGHGSINDISNYLCKKFKLDLTNFSKWSEVVEATFRRNLVIHNKGVTNDVYCKLTGYNERGVHLDIDIEYIVSSAQNLIDLNDFMFSTLLEKFKLS
ncbi:hypothetical protein V6457_004441 [Vibrio vulnificus]|nr:hypothetical protein [Vibrio vulnificus]EKA7352278.1 hypothetical protein [Vibrio vulnificus]ELE7615535.1 hypothetical protein [Vibrio vulnificus]MCU8221346.1 hypothetical protein [Vibrio vulnificus]